MKKILMKIEKFEKICGRPGGRGVSKFGHPRTRGGGGVKKGQIFADVLYGCPLNVNPRIMMKIEPYFFTYEPSLELKAITYPLSGMHSENICEKS